MNLATIFLGPHSTGIIAELPPELSQVNSVLGGHSRSQKNYRHVIVIARAKLRVFANVNFRESRAKFLQQGRDLRLCFLAQVATGPRINGNVARTCELQASIFGSRIHARPLARTQPSALHELCHYVAYNGSVTK